MGGGQTSPPDSAESRVRLRTNIQAISTRYKRPEAIPPQIHPHPIPPDGYCPRTNTREVQETSLHLELLQRSGVAARASGEPLALSKGHAVFRGAS